MARKRRGGGAGQPALFADLHFMLGALADDAPEVCAITGGRLAGGGRAAAGEAEDPTEVSWYEPLNALRSRGSEAPRPGSLAGLHAQRDLTLSQFFTPNAVVKFIWELITPALEESRTYGKHTIFDNSFGSGRMFQYADPEKHFLVGCEIDGQIVDRVKDAVTAAGFECHLEQGSMEEFRPRNFHVGLINPPFSIMLDNPLVEPFKCNSYGRYGPRSSAKSHLYALAQALSACDVVVAVMPAQFRRVAEDPGSVFYPRLHTIFRLPRGTFREEGTEVDVSLFVFNRREVEAEHKRAFELSDLVMRDEYLAGDERTDNYLGRTRDLHVCRAESGKRELPRATAETGRAAVTLPATGDKTVRLCHTGRRLVLKFKCGLAQAMVLNRVYESRISDYRRRDEGRLPRGVHFSGEGYFDLENYVVQPEPLAALSDFARRIREWGFDPVIDAGLRNYLRKRARRQLLLTTPLRQTVFETTAGGSRKWLAQQQQVVGRCVRPHTVWERDGGPRIPEGEELTFTRKAGARGERFEYRFGTFTSSISEDNLFAWYEFPEAPEVAEGWALQHAGLREQFSELWKWTEAQARRAGVDRWLTWGYQWHDAIEVAMRRGNTIVGWEMGLGKARLALALCLIGGGKQNLIVLESRLVGEMQDEIRGLSRIEQAHMEQALTESGLAPSQWQVIERLDQLVDADGRHLPLRRINIVSYNKLRTAERTARGKKRYPVADVLRRRVHTMVVDEGHNLKDVTSDQGRAAWRVAARNRYILTGTPIDNYPRDIMPLMQFVAGDGTAHQPYGGQRPFIESGNLRSMDKAVRGTDRFKNMFVVTEWVTHEFEDGLRTGAKREIPKIADVAAFRRMVAPIVKRRVMREPEVAAYIHIPEAEYKLHQVEWDYDHLVHYMKVSQWFIDWYNNLEKWEKKSNLIAILAKIGAVFTAANYPAVCDVENVGPYAPLTSKQRLVLSRLERLAAGGHKIVLFAHSPAVLDMFAGLLTDRGISNVLFHGGVTISKRVRAMDKEFRNGPAQVLLGSTGCLQTGYNIWQADRALFYNRSWTPKVEWQAAARLLRPQQRKRVVVEHFELSGSIDMYMRQMVEFKGETMRAGLDYGQETLEAKDFLHIEAILDQFVKDFEGKMGIKLREVISS